jgi:hypothetical protein
MLSRSGRTIAPQPLLSFAYSVASCAAIAVSSAWARSTETPGLQPPTDAVVVNSADRLLLGDHWSGM